MVLLLTMTATVRYVQAIELGGFDVDMGTEASKEMLLTGIMMQRRNQPEMRIMPAVMAFGAIQTVPGLPGKLQKQEMMCSRKQEERIFSSGQYETEASGASYNEETSEEDEISDRQAENGSVNNHTDSELEISESQFSDPENLSKYSSHTSQ